MNKKDKDEDGDGSIFSHLDKTQVLQEARIFNSTPIKPRQCRTLLTKIIYLLNNQKDAFSVQEATELFFGVTKLFQHKDAPLRQMVYVVVKELAGIAEDTIMVTSSVMKDTVTTSDVIYRPNAIRALCRIIDASSVQSIERIIKTAVVDKVPSVSSAALVSSYHLFPIAKDAVRRWANETQEAVVTLKSSPSAGGSSYNMPPLIPNSTNITQYHALGLLYLMRHHDRMALVKMIQQFWGLRDSSSYSSSSMVNSPLKSPLAVVLLVRFTAKVIEEDPNMRKPLYAFLESWLRHKSDMVNFEAAKAICELKDVTETEVSPAVSVLQLFLSSPRFVCRFAAIRILNRLAMIRPSAVVTCNFDIENLITDANRSIATFAITTLLKTGNEASVDRLMKQITGFMSDISDEFKVIVVDAIRSLCLKFPSRQATMLSFLSGVLRDEGGFEFKKSVVEAMFDMIKFIPEAKEEALSQLCEFIEDCEFGKLAVRILYTIGVEGPRTSNPTKYIRFIYNRVVLENAFVRAAAVTALAKFGVAVEDPKVKKSIKVLLTRCLDDPDDEVRDRAALNLKLMDDAEIGAKFIKSDATWSLPVLEHQLVLYVSESQFTKEFNAENVPLITREQADAELLRAKNAETSVTPQVKSEPTKPTGGIIKEAAQQYSSVLRAIKPFESYGALLKSSSIPVALTESETEYVVKAVKHIFKEYIILQYDVTNTLQETILEKVSVEAVPEDDEALAVDQELELPSLKSNEPGSIYVSFRRNDPSAYSLGGFSNVLKFHTKEIDPSTGEPDETGYDDEYEVENLELTIGDYLIPTYIGNFDASWNELGDQNQASETFALSNLASLEEACSTIIELLSLQPLESTDTPVSSATHKMKLSGRSTLGAKVVVQAQMAYSAKSGVTLKLTARSDSEELANLVVNAF